MSNIEELDSIASEYTQDFPNYQLEDTPIAELHNNLTIVNSIVARMELEGTPIFYILGGAALAFHGLNYNFTLDIDTANRICDNIKEEVGIFIDDAASEVTKLPINYRTRAVRIREDLGNCVFYVLGYEDLFITKVLAGRSKDFRALETTGISNRVDVNLLRSIVTSEIRPEYSSKIESAIVKYVL